MVLHMLYWELLTADSCGEGAYKLEFQHGKRLCTFAVNVETQEFTLAQWCDV